MEVPTHLERSHEVKRIHSKYGTAWNHNTRKDPRGSSSQCAKQLVTQGFIWEYEENDVDEALECYNEALSYERRNEEALYRKGVLLLEQKNDTASAGKCFTRIVNKINNFNPDAWAKLAKVELQLRNYEAAYKNYKRAIENSDENEEQEVPLYRLLIDAGKLNCIVFNRFEAAMKQFKKVFKATDERLHIISAYKHIGFCQLWMHDFEDALQSFKKGRRKAVRHAPREEGWFQLWKCFCYACLGDYKRAWKCHCASFHLDKEPHDKKQLHLLQVFGDMAVRKNIQDYEHFFREYDTWRESIDDILKEVVYLPKYALEVLFEVEGAQLKDPEGTTNCPAKN